MVELSIKIGELSVDAIGRLVDEDRIEETLRKALMLLSERLRASPFARGPEAMALALTSMEISDFPQDAWTGQRGAERIADALYEHLTANIKNGAIG